MSLAAQPQASAKRQHAVADALQADAAAMPGRIEAAAVIGDDEQHATGICIGTQAQAYLHGGCTGVPDGVRRGFLHDAVERGLYVAAEAVEAGATIVDAQVAGLKLLVLSMHDREPYISEALRRGVHGYVTKGAATDELVTAVRAVCAGQLYLSSDIVAARPGAVHPQESLSEREREVFLMLARGATPKQIASDLGISDKTVYLHRAAVRTKIGARSDLDLHRIAIERGLL